MNGEEKILAILEQLQQGQARLEQGYAKLEQGQAATNARLDKLEQGQSKLEQRMDDLDTSFQAVKNSQIRVELEQFPRIAAALEGHMLNSEKLDDILKNLEEITPIVNALEILHQTGYAK